MGDFTQPGMIFSTEQEAKLFAELTLLRAELAAANKRCAELVRYSPTGFDSGSAEAEARDKIQQIGYAETLRRVGDCGKWSLTWESVSNILELLQEGIISRRKCHETLNSILHGERTNLPALEACAFDDVELPGETVRKLRQSAFYLSNDLDMATGKLDQAQRRISELEDANAQLAAALARQVEKNDAWQAAFEAIEQEDMTPEAHAIFHAVYQMTNDAEAQDIADRALEVGQ